MPSASDLKIPANSTALERAIGHTPMFPIRRLVKHLPEVDLRVKAEWLNPGGSVKDRAALEMVQRGRDAEALRPGQIILEATSGNTGIALAMLGAVHGLAVRLCIPENVSPERKRTAKAYGAELIETSALEGTDGAVRQARELHETRPELYFYPDQYNNPANWQAHYRTTANEIWEQTSGQISHFVAGLGTSGTFTGVTRRLKELSPGIRCVAIQPDSPFHGIEGLRHMDTAVVPGIYDGSLEDESSPVSSEDAFEMTRRLAREEGLFVGLSSGAAMVATLRVAEQAGRGVFVTVFPDGGSRYLSDPSWKES